MRRVDVMICKINQELCNSVASCVTLLVRIVNKICVLTSECDLNDDIIISHLIILSLLDFQICFFVGRKRERERTHAKKDTTYSTSRTKIIVHQSEKRRRQPQNKNSIVQLRGLSVTVVTEPIKFFLQLKRRRRRQAKKNDSNDISDYCASMQKFMVEHL